MNSSMDPEKEKKDDMIRPIEMVGICDHCDDEKMVQNCGDCGLELCSECMRIHLES